MGRKEHSALVSDPSGFPSGIFLEPLPAQLPPGLHPSPSAPPCAGSLTECPFPTYSLHAAQGPSLPTVPLCPGTLSPLSPPTLPLSCAVTVPGARCFMPSCRLLNRSALHFP